MGFARRTQNTFDGKIDPNDVLFFVLNKWSDKWYYTFF